jgi:hypothetical protein
MILSEQKRDRAAAAYCTRLVLAACSSRGVLAAATTTLTTKRAGCWAVTVAKPTKDFLQHDVYRAVTLSGHVPPSDVIVEGVMLTRTVKVWWKIK